MYMTIEKLQNFDKTKLNDLIDEFEACGDMTETFAQAMRKWIPYGDLLPDDKRILVKWCKPSRDTRNCGRKVARDISMLLFDKVITDYD